MDVIIMHLPTRHQKGTSLCPLDYAKFRLMTSLISIS